MIIFTLDTTVYDVLDEVFLNHGALGNIHLGRHTVPKRKLLDQVIFFVSTYSHGKLSKYFEVPYILKGPEIVVVKKSKVIWEIFDLHH